MNYEQKKEKLLKDFAKRNKLAIKKKTSHLYGDRIKQKRSGLDMTVFNKVISIDKNKLIAEVEGMCTYETFVDATLKHGLLPTVAPELKSITVGGAYAGIGVESSTFKFGFVHETILESDILTPKGIVTCSKDKNSDLFFTFPNTYGTLGYATRVKVMLIKAKKYVKVQKFLFADADEFIEKTKEVIKTNPDFVDGLVFSPTEHILCVGTFTDTPGTVSDYTYLNVFYKSVRKPGVDYLKTRDYIFRYDTDLFWASKSLGLENRFLRRLVGKKRLRSDWYYKLLKFETRYKILATIHNLVGKKSESLIQDVEIPIDKAADYLRWFQKNICSDIPIVFGPGRQFNKKVTYHMWPFKELTMNLGFYSSIPSKLPPGTLNKRYDQKMIKEGCYKMLYSNVTLTKKEFWSMFNEKKYNQVKSTYDPDSQLKDLYTKCTSR